MKKKHHYWNSPLYSAASREQLNKWVASITVETQKVTKLR